MPCGPPSALLVRLKSCFNGRVNAQVTSAHSEHRHSILVSGHGLMASSAVEQDFDMHSIDVWRAAVVLSELIFAEILLFVQAQN
jgi:hypothetical protein